MDAYPYIVLTYFFWRFEGCPNGADTFATGLGLTLFDEQGQKAHTVELQVSGTGVDVGCGGRFTFEFGKKSYSCLGAGSLEVREFSLYPFLPLCVLLTMCSLRVVGFWWTKSNKQSRFFFWRGPYHCVQYNCSLFSSMVWFRCDACRRYWCICNKEPSAFVRAVAITNSIGCTG